MLCSKCTYYVARQCKIIQHFAKSGKKYCDGKWFFASNEFFRKALPNPSNAPNKVPS